MNLKSPLVGLETKIKHISESTKVYQSKKIRDNVITINKYLPWYIVLSKYEQFKKRKKKTLRAELRMRCNLCNSLEKGTIFFRYS